jgi:hypothetical protein
MSAAFGDELEGDFGDDVKPFRRMTQAEALYLWHKVKSQEATAMAKVVSEGISESAKLKSNQLQAQRREICEYCRRIWIGDRRDSCCNCGAPRPLKGK